LTQLHKKEYIRLYGVLAESLEESIIPFLPKILAHLARKVREGDEKLQEAVSYAYGMIVHNTLHFIPDLPSSCN